MKKYTAGLLLMGILVACPSGSVPLPTLPLNFAGTYAISGTNPDNSVYTGTMTVTTYGDGYRISQTIGTSTFTGVANDINDFLATAVIVGGQPIIAFYQVTAANKLSGFWQDFNSPKTGTESATHNQFNAFARIPSALLTSSTNYAGTYNIAGTNPNGSTYLGTMTIAAYGDGYRATTTIGSSTFRGIGSTLGKYVAMAFNNGGAPLIALYENTDTGALRGVWQGYNDTKEGTENLTKQ